MRMICVVVLAVGELGYSASRPAVAQRISLELETLLVTHDPYVVGRHTARLDFAVSECGGQYDALKVDPLLKGLVQKQDREATLRYQIESNRGFNDERMRLGRLRGTTEVCGRLYELYGPNGISAKEAYDPTTMGYCDRPIEPKAWFKALGLKAKHRDADRCSDAGSQPSAATPPLLHQDSSLRDR